MSQTHPLDELRPHLPPGPLGTRAYHCVAHAVRPGYWDGTAFRRGETITIETVEALAALTDDELLDLRNLGPRALAVLRRAQVAVLGEPVRDHYPRRGDQVEAWLKSERERYSPGDPGWFTLDRLLDDYRDHADIGAHLGQELDDSAPMPVVMGEWNP